MRTLLLVIIYLAFISLGLPDSLLGTAWPAAYRELGVSVSMAGFLYAVVSFGTIISSLNSGRIIRRFGTGVTTTVSVAMTAAALLGFSVSPSFGIMFFFAIPLGLGAGSVDAALNNYVALHYGARHMNWLHSFWGIGASLGPAIMSFCLTRGSWRSGYATIGWIQTALVMVLIGSLPLWTRLSAASKAGQNAGRIFSAKELVKMPGARQVLIAFFCYCAVEATAGLWGSSFLVLTKGIAPDTAASWVSLYYFGITFGRLLSGFLTLRISNKNLVRLGQGLIVLGILLIMTASMDVVLLCGFFTIGLGCAPIFPALIHDTPENFGSEASQSFMGLQMACAYVGTTVMPPLFGFLGENLSMGLLPIYLLVNTLVMVAMLERLNRIKAAKASGARQQ
ncbi:MAG TPA: MFS transporter [Thermoclostridium caenicola]|uniref:MFS transporter n=1 Tax=Thermoclostridium caenicola TaxID=659425 RepID=UPI002B7CF515|nr:MFS transporter [Thermoclostridium caenicola]HOK43998.1 MFS transporter [Thermoclostridium caenicola]HPO77786.1 MFS transporter [Thermoclostridium caenicola]